MKILFSLMAFCVAGVAPAIADEGPELDEIVRTALSRFNGEATGKLSGEMAAFFRKTTQSTSQVTVKVRVLRWYTDEPGCARLQVMFRQPEVKTADGQRIQFQNGMELSKCRDDHQPRAFEPLRAIPFISTVAAE